MSASNNPGTFASIASDAAAFFTTKRRDEADETSQFVSLTGDVPEWLREMVYRAHGDMLPDDYRYAMVDSALDLIATLDDDVTETTLDEIGSEFADNEVSVYNRDRLDWLSSSLTRAAFVDEAAEEGLIAPDADTFTRIGVGWYTEAEQVWSTVVQCLVERAEEIENRHYVTETIDGMTWRVRLATFEEMSDPDEETLPLSESLDHGREVAERLGSDFVGFVDVEEVRIHD
jgi:hypothetical protein